MMLLAGLFLGPASAGAQVETDEEFNHRVDPNCIFDFVSCHTYCNNMNVTALVQKDGKTVVDALVAVYASDGIRGKDVTDPSQDNQVFLTVYGEKPVPLVFKVYAGGNTYVVDQGLTFEGNATIGMDDPYVITLQDSLIPGDANGDGIVSISDAVAVVNSILGQPSSNFIKTAADVNNDGYVTISDAVAIVNIILNNTSG